MSKLGQIVKGIGLVPILRKMWSALTGDLWILLMDIITVNLAYFLAIMIRFSVNWSFRPFVLEVILPAYQHFAPWYTIATLIVFGLCRLYGGLWRYAGLNDLNRIILASICSTAIQIAGSSLFVMRMPLSYYIIGAVLQFFFTAVIRFSYRIFTAEIEKVASKKLPSVNSIVVGLGEIGRLVIKQLQTNKANNIVAIVDDTDQGKYYDGISIIRVSDIASFASTYEVKRIFIADETLKPDIREGIVRFCESCKIEIEDYTGALANVDEAVSISSLLNLIKGKVILKQYGDFLEYENGYQAQQNLTGRYSVESIESVDDRIILELRPNQQVVFILNSDNTEASFVGYDSWQKRKQKDGKQ